MRELAVWWARKKLYPLGGSFQMSNTTEQDDACHSTKENSETKYSNPPFGLYNPLQQHKIESVTAQRVRLLVVLLTLARFPFRISDQGSPHPTRVAPVPPSSAGPLYQQVITSWNGKKHTHSAILTKPPKHWMEYGSHSCISEKVSRRIPFLFSGDKYKLFSLWSFAQARS